MLTTSFDYIWQKPGLKTHQLLSEHCYICTTRTSPLSLIHGTSHRSSHPSCSTLILDSFLGVAHRAFYIVNWLLQVILNSIDHFSLLDPESLPSNKRRRGKNNEKIEKLVDYNPLRRPTLCTKQDWLWIMCGRLGEIYSFVDPGRNALSCLQAARRIVFKRSWCRAIPS